MVTGDAHITRVLGMGMPKTRGCSYHFDIGTLKTRRKLGRVNFPKTSGTVTWEREKY